MSEQSDRLSLAEEALRQAKRDIKEWEEDLDYDYRAEVESWEAQLIARTEFSRAVASAVDRLQRRRYVKSPSGKWHHPTCGLIPDPRRETESDWIRKGFRLHLDDWKLTDTTDQNPKWASCCVRRFSEDPPRRRR